MSVEWGDLTAALAIVLMVEGIMPFVNPPAMKRALARLVTMGDRELRLGGLFSLVAGVALLYWVRS